MKKPTSSVLDVKENWISKRSVNRESKVSRAFPGAEITDDAETLNFSTIYGETRHVLTKTLCWKDVMYVKEKNT